MSRRLAPALAIAVTASMLAVPAAYAWHSGPSSSAPSSSQYQPGASTPSASPSSGAPMTERMQRVPAAAPGAGETAFSATVSGQVTSIDHGSGRLTMNTLDGPLSVRFPPSAVQGVNRGDHITVGFGLIENQPSASPSSPSPSGAPSATPGGSPSGSSSSATGSSSGWRGSGSQ